MASALYLLLLHFLCRDHRSVVGAVIIMATVICLTRLLAHPDPYSRGRGLVNPY
jgi:hypothetical protein